LINDGWALLGEGWYEVILPIYDPAYVKGMIIIHELGKKDRQTDRDTQNVAITFHHQHSICCSPMTRDKHLLVEQGHRSI
jgi:hypothetical protein